MTLLVSTAAISAVKTSVAPTVSCPGPTWFIGAGWRRLFASVRFYPHPAAVAFLAQAFSARLCSLMRAKKKEADRNCDGEEHQFKHVMGLLFGQKKVEV
ncbi:hypothetical protein [Epibacterium ulvae]|uniref:hypothetical protein n=1 Tax=Epibacterium ulvae TaxID=1156985 RepID=UPI0024931601|nr:hypothetical protein [Epibacterium ulvae]